MSVMFLLCVTGSIFPNRCYNTNTLPNLSSLSRTARSFSSSVIISSNKLLVFVTGSLFITPHFEQIHPIPLSSVLKDTHFNCLELCIIWKLTSTYLLLVPFQTSPRKNPLEVWPPSKPILFLLTLFFCPYRSGLFVSLVIQFSQNSHIHQCFTAMLASKQLWNLPTNQKQLCPWQSLKQTFKKKKRQ